MKDDTANYTVRGDPRAATAKAKSACRCCRIVSVMLLAFAVAVLAAAWGLGQWLEAPGQSASKADVIVVLGGDTGSRLVTTVDLYRRGYASAVFLAGIESDELS